ncbi:MAG TPA: polysaccharide deacetylase family protein, partial [Candidatus Polarisedimenticolaceae bacterium]|nr:polysaccharide deacetylase family protein [Candidatus Polarisedimenticolaceae bacterium]
MHKVVSHWPGNHRMAVMITVMFEVWSEGKAPPYSPMTTALKPGTPDLLGISWSQYGGRTGVWRLMRILDECDVRGTVCLNAKCAEDFPAAVKQLHDRGHEISAHSYTQDLVLPYLSAQEEKDLIQKCSCIIESTVGTRPVGWFSPVAAPTVNTARFLAEEGFLWHGDYNDTDLPYPINTPAGPLVAVAHSDFTDNRTLRSSPRDFYNVYKDTFNFLYRTESPSLINLTVHTHFVGRPLMSAMLSELLDYMKGFA